MLGGVPHDKGAFQVEDVLAFPWVQDLQEINKKSFTPRFTCLFGFVAYSI